MTQTYNITGMTCGSCVARAKSELLKIGDITEADVQLAAPQATISMEKHISVQQLQAALAKAGPYTITEANGSLVNNTEVAEKSSSWLQTYKPIFLIAGYITAISSLVATSGAGVDWMLWMRVFMSGFFLMFSFFKLLNLRAFADSYAMYDIVAKQWPAWGVMYAFIELALGLAYAANFNPVLTNGVTFVVMSVSLVGVLQSVLNKKKIRCACLGAVFNLPMSTITIVEDAAMILMSGVMLVSLLY